MLIRSICIVVMLHGSCAVKLKRRTHASHNAAVLAAVIDATASTYERVDEPGKAASDILLFHAPCPALRPDQRTAIENLSALVQKFFGGGIRSIELGTALHALPDMGVYSDLTRKIVTAVSMNDINEIVALFVGNAGGAIVRSVPWACLASIGLLWTVFTSLMYACTELHPKALPTHNVTQSYPDLVLYPPFHVSVFGVFEQATGFDYRLCAKFFVNPWHVTEKSDAAEGGVADCQPGILWPHALFEDLATSLPCDFACANALAFSRLARSWDPMPTDAPDTLRSGFTPTAYTMAQRALHRLSLDPLTTLHEMCSAQHFTPWFIVLTDTYPPRSYGTLVSPREGTPKAVEGCDAPPLAPAYLGYGDLYISGWPPRQRSSPAEALSMYRLLHDTTPILEHFGIHWWADAGTLIGAWRHHGLMPQECDLDFALWHNELYLFSPGGPLVKALAERGIHVFFLIGSFRAIRISYKRIDRYTHLPGAWNYLSIMGPYLDLHMASLVPKMYKDHQSQKWHIERWAYTFFPDDRYAFPKSFSLTGLFDLRNQTVVADRREKWPFGETYVYVPEKGSPAARYDDYLGKVYGNDWTTTLRERDAKTTDEPLMRQFIHRVTNHSAFYGVVAQPTGPLYPPLTAEPSFREKRYDWPPLA